LFLPFLTRGGVFNKAVAISTGVRQASHKEDAAIAATSCEPLASMPRRLPALEAARLVEHS
jgi:hypothetical protein